MVLVRIYTISEQKSFQNGLPIFFLFWILNIWKHTPGHATPINTSSVHIKIMVMVYGYSNGKMDTSSGKRFNTGIIMFCFIIMIPIQYYS